MPKGMLFRSLIFAAGTAIACENNTVSPTEDKECDSSIYCPVTAREPAKPGIIKNLESMIEFYRDNESPRIRELAKNIPPDSDAEVDQEKIRDIQEALVFHGYMDYARNGELDAETIYVIYMFR